MTHSLPSAVLVAWLKSTPPGTADSCLANLGPDSEDVDEPELTNEEGELEKELVSPNEELWDGKELDELNDGGEENSEVEEKEFVLEVKVLEGGEAGLPMMVWKWEGWMADDDLLKVFCPGVPDGERADPA